MLLAQGVKGWQEESLAHSLMEHPHQELSRLRCKSICTISGPKELLLQEAREKSEEAQRKCRWPRLRKSRADASERTVELISRHFYPLLKCIVPGKDMPDIPSQWFNDLVTEMKTNSFVCSDPFWAFGSGNPSTGAEVRTRLPVIPQVESLTARICSAARMDEPGDTLWDLIKHEPEGQWGWRWRSYGYTQNVYTYHHCQNSEAVASTDLENTIWFVHKAQTHTNFALKHLAL